MEPTLSPQELIVIDEKNSYSVGDIVTYSDSENFLITHRIVQIQNNNFISKGDANNINDEVAEIKTIEGKVIFHSKILGIFILYLLKPIIFLYIIIILLIELTRLLKDKENDKDKEKEEKKDEIKD
jgi:signal peptidase